MRLSRSLFNLSHHIEYYSKFQPSSFTLKSLIDFGTYERRSMSVCMPAVVFLCPILARDGDHKQSFKFLRVELLIRWSHMRKEMTYLPSK